MDVTEKYNITLSVVDMFNSLKVIITMIQATINSSFREGNDPKELLMNLANTIPKMSPLIISVYIIILVAKNIISIHSCTD